MDPTRYLGIPWQPGGASRRGADCWGLVRLVQRAEYGRRLPRLGILPDALRRRMQAFGAAARHAPQWRRLPHWRAATEGDVLIMGPDARRLLHIGILVGAGRVLHAVPGAGSVCEPADRLALRGLVYAEAWTCR